MYTPFNTLKTTELKLTAQGWFRPSYELTDGQFVYGKLSYQGWFRRVAIAETAATTWTFRFEGFWGRKINISTENGVIGQLKIGMWGKASLLMNDGFEAELVRDTIWKPSFVWSTTRFGEVVKLKQKGFTRSLSITLDPNTSKIELVPMLCFLGAHLIFLRQQQAAASH